MVKARKRRAGRKRKQQITLPKMEIAVIEVDDPYFDPKTPESRSNPRKMKATINARESYAMWLYARRHIDKAELKAASRIRRSWERLGGAGAKAIDYTSERVDGGQIAQTITDDHLEAARDLRAAAAVLGPAGYDLTIKLACMGLWISDLSPKEVHQKYLGMRFRECLDSLAAYWGFKTRPVRSTIGEEKVRLGA